MHKSWNRSPPPSVYSYLAVSPINHTGQRSYLLGIGSAVLSRSLFHVAKHPSHLFGLGYLHQGSITLKPQDEYILHLERHRYVEALAFCALGTGSPSLNLLSVLAESVCDHPTRFPPFLLHPLAVKGSSKFTHRPSPSAFHQICLISMQREHQDFVRYTLTLQSSTLTTDLFLYRSVALTIQPTLHLNHSSFILHLY